MSVKKNDIDRKLRIGLPSTRDFFLILSIGLIVGYLGPFGSFAFPIWVRLPYWVMAIAIGHGVFSFVYRYFFILAEKRNIHFAITFIAGAAVGSLFLSAILVQITGYFFDSSPSFLSGFIFIYPQVFVISIAAGIVNVFANGSFDRYFSTNEAAGKNFIDRLPTHLGSDLICFVMEDHYLRVYTASGNDLILHRMKDALTELENYEGMQVHRSWWIAKTKIKRVQRDGRKMTLIMSNDVDVPVSRTYQPALKEAGIF